MLNACQCGGTCSDCQSRNAFASEEQRKWAWANDPDLAHSWAHDEHTADKDHKMPEGATYKGSGGVLRKGNVRDKDTGKLRKRVANIVRKVGGKWRLYSHKGKNLGTFDSQEAAEKHEREVQYFKHNEAAMNKQEVEDSLRSMKRRDLERLAANLGAAARQLTGSKKDLREFVANAVGQPRHPVEGVWQGKAKNSAERGFDTGHHDDQVPVHPTEDDEGHSIDDEDDEIGQGDRPPKARTKEDDRSNIEPEEPHRTMNATTDNAGPDGTPRNAGRRRRPRGGRRFRVGTWTAGRSCLLAPTPPGSASPARSRRSPPCPPPLGTRTWRSA